MASDQDFFCRVVTPERNVFEGEVQAVGLPGSEGNFGVLVDHTPYVAKLAIGEIKLSTTNGTRYVACSGGFARVIDNEVTVLSETAEMPDEIDVERAQKAYQRAKDRLRTSDSEEIDVPRARNALQRAENRLRVAGVDMEEVLSS